MWEKLQRSRRSKGQAGSADSEMRQLRVDVTLVQTSFWVATPWMVCIWSWSALRYNTFHADAVFAEILIGRRALAFRAISMAAAFAGCQTLSFFSTDFTCIFFLAHKAPLLVYFGLSYCSIWFKDKSRNKIFWHYFNKDERSLYEWCWCSPY